MTASTTTGQGRVRVLVVDDHPVVRAGMVALLSESPDIDIVAEAADGAQALVAVSQHPVDVVLMDLRMPVLDGVAATAAIHALPHAPHVLILTTYDTDADIVRAVEAGARGYLLKDTPPHELAEAIRRAARGETVLAAGMASRLHARRTLPTHSDLTSREIEVLQLVAQGLSNAEVGGRLFIGEATVKTHLVRIFGKLGVTDRTAAVTTAYGLGLLPLP
ncbi:MAG TPA: response regulator transcription factor [Dermatophilaceae bacterium]|jgi:DNA-binding NarL/FixJ family response regulator|nr:response regulator transcription factor [Actinomycetales bacterium]HMT31580.1 response regulator transcription factor [Dermatophilaceae bacterium]HMT88329.1 response regulator transcription factor [Dermatophilaceae bacterium]